MRPSASVASEAQARPDPARRRRKRRGFAVAGVAALVLVAGCGQKGSLYLPAAAPAASAPASR